MPAPKRKRPRKLPTKSVAIRPAVNPAKIAEREQLAAARLVSRLIGYHSRLSTAYAQHNPDKWAYNEARLAALHKALVLIKGPK